MRTKLVTLILDYLETVPKGEMVTTPEVAKGVKNWTVRWVGDTLQVLTDLGLVKKIDLHHRHVESSWCLAGRWVEPSPMGEPKPGVVGYLLESEYEELSEFDRSALFECLPTSYHPPRWVKHYHLEG
jgi:hypothetical protein